MPWSNAERIVLIDSRSSVPPHIHPPIAQVPRPIRDISMPVLPILLNSMFLLLSRFVGIPLNRLHRLAVTRGLSDVHCDLLARTKITADLDRVAVVVADRHFDQFEMVVAHNRQINFVVAEYERVVGRRQ